MKRWKERLKKGWQEHHRWVLSLIIFVAIILLMWFIWVRMDEDINQTITEKRATEQPSGQRITLTISHDPCPEVARLFDVGTTPPVIYFCAD